MKQTTKTGGFYRAFCTISRVFTKRHTVQTKELPYPPVVYISRHQNFYAPLQMMFWYPETIRFWVLDSFFERQTCVHQYAYHVFHKRMKLPMPLARICAYPIAWVLPAFFHSACSIPVHRGTKSIFHTLKESVETLTSGQSIAIFIDVDYKKTEGEITDIYKGFLFLEKYYFKQTKQHIRFVPLHVNRKQRTITNGNTISFSSDQTFDDQKETVYHTILDCLNQLARDNK